jgi:hypothetical protein
VQESYILFSYFISRPAVIVKGHLLSIFLFHYFKAGMYLGHNISSSSVYLVSTVNSSNPNLWKARQTGASEGDFTLTAIGAGGGSEQPALLSYDHTECSPGGVSLSNNITDERDVLWRWVDGRLIAAVSWSQVLTPGSNSLQTNK